MEQGNARTMNDRAPRTISLRNATLAGLALLMVALVALLTSSGHALVLSGAQEAEREGIERDLLRVQGVLERELEALRRTGRVWGWWDETYDYLHGRAPDYEATNLGELTFENLELDLMGFFDAAGRPRHLAWRQEPVPISPQDLSGLLFLDFEAGEPRAGLLNLPGNPLLVAAVPVLRSDGSGPSAGTLIVGRRLIPDLIEHVQQVTLLTLQVWDLAEPDLPERVQGVAAALQRDRTPVIEPLRPDLLQSTVLLDDVHGAPALLLEVSSTRDAYQQALVSIRYRGLIAALLGVGLIAFSLLLLEITVLAPLARLSRDVQDIGERGGRAARVGVYGRAELRTLGLAVNQMLERIERSQRDQARAEGEMRGVFLAAHDILFIKDRALRYTQVNPAISRMIGELPEGVIGRTDEDVLAPALAEQIRAQDARVLQGEVVEAEHTLEIGGARRSFHVVRAPLHDERGQVVGLCGIARETTERAAAEERLRRQNATLNLLFEAGKRLSRSLDPDEVYAVLHDLVGREMDVDTLLVSAYDARSRLITCQAGWHEGRRLDAAALPPIPLEPEGSGVQSQVIRTGAAERIDDYPERLRHTRTVYHLDGQGPIPAPTPDSDTPQTQSALVVPVRREGRVAGVVQVMSYRPAAYTDEHLRLLEALVGQAAVAEANALLYRSAQLEIRERTRVEAALRASEASYRLLFDSVADAVFLHDSDGRVVEVNQVACERMGYTREQLIGLTPADYAAPEHAAQVPARVERILRDGLAVFESVHVRADGTRIPVEVNARVFLRAGEAMLLSVVRDITERKREQQLREAVYRVSEAASRVQIVDELYPAVHEAIASLMPARNFYVALYDSERDELAFPYVVDELEPPPPPGPLGRGLTAYVIRSAAPLQAPAETFERLAAAGEVEALGPPAVDWLGAPLRLGARVLGVLAVQSYSEGVRYSARDAQMLVFVAEQVAMAIERARAAEALRESEGRLRSLLASQGEGTAVVDTEERFLFANPAAERAFGVDPGGLIGRSLTEFLDPAGRESVRQQTQLRQQGETGRYEFEILRPDGLRRHLSLTATPWLAQDGKFLGSIGVFRDVTEQKRSAQRMEYLSTHDTLTELFNRAYFEVELSRLQRGRAFPVSVIVVDVDHLKQTNDAHGHAAGDELLRRAARVLRMSFRAEDVVARTGGDEFGVLLPQTNAAAAGVALERVRRALAEHNLGRYEIPLSLSIGAATGERGDSLSAVLEQADARMYQDKLSRRDGEEGLRPRGPSGPTWS